MPEETTTTTAPAESSSGSYVQTLNEAGGEGLDGAAGGAPPQQADSGQGTTPDQPNRAPDGKFAAATLPSVDDLIQQYAKEYGADPNDKLQRAWLKRIADKEFYIQQLKAGQSSAAAIAAPTTGPTLLTSFEKELAAERAPAANGETTPPPETAAPPASANGSAPATPTYGDVGDDWKTPEESLNALNEAWADNDMGQVQAIEVARMKRNFDSEIAPVLIPYLARMMERKLEEFYQRQLGDVAPEMRRAVADRRVTESAEFALDELRKAGAEDLDALFVEEEGPPIEFDGEQFPNTPLNRVLSRHPEILRIQEHHSDPVKAERKTLISRYKLAYQIYKQGAGPSAETARKLVEAGRESRERDAQDRARQTINAGAGATGHGERKTGSYISELNNLQGDIPFASLTSST